MSTLVVDAQRDRKQTIIIIGEIKLFDKSQTANHKKKKQTQHLTIAHEVTFYLIFFFLCCVQ